jgi:two-component system, OmpR family, KDP operon response regulator KdpE
MNDACVLLIDDEPAIVRVLRPALEGHHYEVVAASTGAEGLSQLEKHHPDLILLDLSLPDIDGVTLAGLLRERTEAPIIVLSVRSGDQDKIAALDNGANDYVTKPFSMGELLARIRAALRSYQRQSYQITQEQQISIGEVTLDVDRHAVTVRGTPVHFSPTEFSLLEILMRNAGRLVTHRTLLHNVWGTEYINETQLLRVYIGHLRSKIEPQPDRPQYIITEPGVGYRFTESV